MYSIYWSTKKKLTIIIIKTRLTLIINAPTLLTKSILIPLELTVAMSAADVGIHEKHPSLRNYNIKKFNEEMKHFMKIVKSPEGSGLLIKGVGKQ